VLQFVTLRGSEHDVKKKHSFKYSPLKLPLCQKNQSRHSEYKGGERRIHIPFFPPYILVPLQCLPQPNINYQSI